MNDQPFPSDLLRRHKSVNEKLKKFKRVLFKRFGPNVHEISDEFNQIAIEFKNASLLEYAAICWQNAAECEHIIENSQAEVDYFLKAARSFCEVDRKLENRNVRSNNKSFIECALQCYDKAMSLLADSPMKVAIAREAMNVQSFGHGANDSVSLANRIRDTEIAADEDVRRKDFIGALDKRTEIFNAVVERNHQHMYCDLIKRNELTRVLLLLLLRLPQSRQSQSHVNLLQMFVSVPPQLNFADELGWSKELFLCVCELVLECHSNDTVSIEHIIEELFYFRNFTKEQYSLLDELNKNFNV